MKFFEKQEKSETKFQGILVEVDHDQVTLIDGSTSTREVVKHPGGVCVAAQLPNKKYLLVKQYRYGVKNESIEFVAGKMEPGIDAITQIQNELQEETGYLCTDIKEVMTIYPSPAYLDEPLRLFTATATTQGSQNLDEHEFLEILELSLDDILYLIDTNVIKDAKTIALAYYLYRDAPKNHPRG